MRGDGGAGQREPLPARFEPTLGWCAREVEEDLPELRLFCAEVEVGAGAPLTRRLAAGYPRAPARTVEPLSRAPARSASGAEPVPAAYRVFFRHIGLDPDVVRTPIEAAVLERMLRGGFLSDGLLADVLLIALVDTGVPVWALDAEAGGWSARHPPEPRGRAAGSAPGAAPCCRPAGS